MDLDLDPYRLRVDRRATRLGYPPRQQQEYRWEALQGQHSERDKWVWALEMAQLKWGLIRQMCSKWVITSDTYQEMWYLVP